MKAPSTFGRRFLKSGWCRCHSFLKLRFGVLVTVLGIAVLVCGQAEAIKYSTNIFVETIAGSGFSGYLDGTNTQTFLNEPWVIVVDQTTNAVFWEHGNNRVREVNPVGIVRTLAGSGMSGLVDGEGTNASFISITSMALLPDSSILLADNATIRRPICGLTLIPPDILIASIAQFSCHEKRLHSAVFHLREALWLLMQNLKAKQEVLARLNQLVIAD